jgi:hypothetical protein
MKSVQDWIDEKTSKVADGGSVPLAKVGLCWDFTDKEAGKVIDMHVVNLDEANAGHPPDANLWDAAGSTSGACVADWGRNPRSTPLGKFAEMCFDGNLPSGQHFVRLLCEFAKIEECDWALHMLAALHMGHIVMPNDDELSL